MRVEVDQSGKVEDTRIDTVLAFSDGISGSVLIPTKIQFSLVGKDSPAHIKAYAIFTGEYTADREVKFEDLKELL